ncbi:unnamed protein product [Amoebophrya sp. A120]|nr:unnamed protein product [Amoebophrya sp. A120]|eukprot:GSA120T00010279001.1
MVKIIRDHESIEDAVRVIWAKRVVPPSLQKIPLATFILVLCDTLKKLQVAPPSQDWYQAAFRNFDQGNTGQITQGDVVDITVQYVNAYLQLNSSRMNRTASTSSSSQQGTALGNSFTSAKSQAAGNNGATGGDHRPFNQWLKDVCWQSFCFVDSDSVGKINFAKMRVAAQSVFDQIGNVSMPKDEWFQQAFKNFDTDSDGYLKYDDYYEIMRQYIKALKKRNINPVRKGQMGTTAQTLDMKLCKATYLALQDVDPKHTGRIDSDQCVEMIKRVWRFVPQMGRQPSTRWCKEAFKNFDRKKQGSISIESFCEIVRQYAAQKVGMYPKGFDHKGVLNGANLENITLGSGGEGLKPGEGMDAVHFLGHVIIPVFTEKAKVLQDYTFMEKKGEGAFGKVCTVKHLRTGVLRACKSITLKNKDQAKLVETEIELMKELDHPNILRLYEVYYDEDTTIYLVTELCNGGSLFDRLIFHTRNLKKPMSERQSGRYVQQILQALAYCHSMGIVHRDVKPDNVLFVTRKADSAVKVIDFGLSDFMRKIEAAAKTVKINADKEVLADGIRRSLGIPVPEIPDPLVRKVMPKAGTPHYMPPEMHHKSWYDAKADVFACGIMLYQMLTGVHPFFIPGKDNAETAKQKIILCKVDWPADLWNNLTPLAKEITAKMLEEKPINRFDCVEALRHPWFNSSKKVTAPIRNSIVDSLLQFQQHNKLKQAVLRLLAKEVDEEKILELRDQFTAMDTSDDGILQLQEVVEAARNVGISVPNREIERMMFTLHGPGLGEANLELGLNYRDFVSALVERKVVIEKNHLLEIFKRFEDPDDPGYITCDSIKKSIKAHRRGDTRRTIQESDFASAELQEILGAGKTKINFETFLHVCFEKGQVADTPPGG